MFLSFHISCFRNAFKIGLFDFASASSRAPGWAGLKDRYFFITFGTQDVRKS
jgi:hypothetical protein